MSQFNKANFFLSFFLSHGAKFQPKMQSNEEMLERERYVRERERERERERKKNERERERERRKKKEVEREVGKEKKESDVATVRKD